VPDGPQKSGLLDMLRFNTRAEMYEENTVAKDVVFIEVHGKTFMMHPLADTTLSFVRTRSFLHDVFHECIKFLTTDTNQTGVAAPVK